VVPDEVTAAWQRVTEQWDDVTRHEAFFALVARHNCYAFAAARYRERAGDPIARNQHDRIRKAVIATMMVSAAARPEPKAPYRSTVVVFLCLIGMTLLGLLIAKRMHDNPPPPTSPRITNPASIPGRP
jgi:hypothetical protein